MLTKTNKHTKHTKFGGVFFKGGVPPFIDPPFNSFHAPGKCRPHPIFFLLPVKHVGWLTGMKLGESRNFGDENEPNIRKFCFYFIRNMPEEPVENHDAASVREEVGYKDTSAFIKAY